MSRRRCSRAIGLNGRINSRKAWRKLGSAKNYSSRCSSVDVTQQGVTIKKVRHYSSNRNWDLSIRRTSKSQLRLTT
jgi:hypothetical protein